MQELCLIHNILSNDTLCFTFQYKFLAVQKINLITEFPVEALKAQKLRYLNLRSNRIQYIPANKMDKNISTTITMLDIGDNLLKYDDDITLYILLISDECAITTAANGC